ncbi:hypothetical protein [Thermococcus sp.]|nr:hypothetical protein [Thermococcus sp.]
MNMFKSLRKAYLLWRSRCPFVRRFEAWRMRRKATEFRVKRK